MTELYTTGGVSLRVWDTTGRMVFGPPDTSIQAEPAQPAEPVELVRRVIAGDTWRTGRVNTGRATPKTYFSEHNVYTNAKALQLTYGGNLPDGVTMDVAASVQRQGDPSSRMVATFGGATTATLTGPAQLVTDDIPLTVSAGDRIEVLTYYGARSDGLAHPATPSGWYGAEILDGNQVATGAPRIANSRAFDGGAGYRPAMPHKITGLADPATISWVTPSLNLGRRHEPRLAPTHLSRTSTRTAPQRLSPRVSRLQTLVYGLPHSPLAAGLVPTGLRFPRWRDSLT